MHCLLLFTQEVPVGPTSPVCNGRPGEFPGLSHADLADTEEGGETVFSNIPAPGGALAAER